MEIEIILMLLSFAGVLGIMASLRGDKTLLLPTGALFLVISVTILGSGVDYHTGWTETEVIDGNTTTITKIKDYGEFEPDIINFVDVFSGLLLITSIYMIFTGATGKKA